MVNMDNISIFHDQSGLKLRPNGSKLNEDLIIERPIGCSRIGISYLSSNANDNRFFLIRELIPTIRATVISENLETLIQKNLNEFKLLGKNVLCRKWIEGKSIEEYLLSEGKIEIYRTIEVGTAIAKYLIKLHSLDLIHGSLHENNIIISDRIIVVDNVLLSNIRDKAFRELKGHIFDSTTNVAPERLRGRPFNQSSDWYSLATILWRMCTGLPPYYIGDTIDKKVEGKPFDSQFPDDFAEYRWFKELMMDMLVSNPALRLDDSDEIYQSLESRAYKSKAAQKKTVREKTKVPAQISGIQIGTNGRSKKRANFLNKAILSNLVLIIFIFGLLFVSVLLNISFKRKINNLNLKISNVQDSIRTIRVATNSISKDFVDVFEEKNREKKQIKKNFETKLDSLQNKLEMTQNELNDRVNYNKRIYDAWIFLKQKHSKDSASLNSKIDSLISQSKKQFSSIKDLTEEKISLKKLITNLADSVKKWKDAYTELDKKIIPQKPEEEVEINKNEKKKN